MFESIRPLQVCGPEEITDLLVSLPGEDLPVKGTGTWVMPDQVYRDTHLFKLQRRIKGAAYSLGARPIHSVECVNFLTLPTDDKQAHMQVGVDNWLDAPAKFTAEFMSDVTDGLVIDYKLAAAKGIWRYISGSSTLQDEIAVDNFWYSKNQADAKLKLHVVEGALLKHLKANESAEI